VIFIGIIDNQYSLFTYDYLTYTTILEIKQIVGARKIGGAKANTWSFSLQNIIEGPRSKEKTPPHLTI